MNQVTEKEMEMILTEAEARIRAGKGSMAELISYFRDKGTIRKTAVEEFMDRAESTMSVEESKMYKLGLDAIRELQNERK